MEEKTQILGTIVPEGTSFDDLPRGITFGPKESRPVLHWRRYADMELVDGQWRRKPLCILEWAAPVRLVQDDDGKPLRFDPVPIVDFAREIAKRWATKRKRCPVCKRRVSRVQVPTIIAPLSPLYTPVVDMRKEARQTLAQLDTFREASSQPVSTAPSNIPIEFEDPFYREFLVATGPEEEETTDEDNGTH